MSAKKAHIAWLILHAQQRVALPFSHHHGHAWRQATRQLRQMSGGCSGTYHPPCMCHSTTATHTLQLKCSSTTCLSSFSFSQQRSGRHNEQRRHHHSQQQACCRGYGGGASARRRRRQDSTRGVCGCRIAIQSSACLQAVGQAWCVTSGSSGGMGACMLHIWEDRQPPNTCLAPPHFSHTVTHNDTILSTCLAACIVVATALGSMEEAHAHWLCGLISTDGRHIRREAA
jgi:hypothetical protein